MRSNRNLVSRVAIVWLVSSCALSQTEPATPPAQDPRDPFTAVYRSYNPGFAFPADMPGEEKQLSAEPRWFTLNLLEESSRANALVEAGIARENAGRFREALEIYQKVIDDYPDMLYRVSDFGVFVPITRYCQLRILKFPKEALSFYRTKHDARAREAYEIARERNSLEGLADIRDRMLCTSYGAPSMLSLGDMALDRGHFLEALEYYRETQDAFPDASVHTPELSLKIAYCRKMLGDRPSSVRKPKSKGALTAAQLGQLESAIERAAPRKTEFHRQVFSEPHASADDYTLMPSTDDALALKEPVWSFRLPGSRLETYVYSQPLISDKSVVYRHKNILYCHSLLNGELRWKVDVGGRVKWQNWNMRQYPQEDVLVQDGLVFSPVFKVGPTLMAIDEITGQMRWAYGPMAASTDEETKMRFETAPAGGPLTVYAGYVLDNIEGDTHTDTEYGVIAFESTTGRIRWRRRVCTLRPGKFAGGFAKKIRNRIRSFISPPLYAQGTVYYCTNAGAIAALDALSGRVKWIMRYPYYRGVHDATRQFGKGGGKVKYTPLYVYPHSPMFWYNQKPLLIGDDLYVTPVDDGHLIKLDRRNGTITWRKSKGEGILARRTDGGAAYFMGPIRSGELAVVYSFRVIHKNYAGPEVGGGVHLIDPKTAKTVWESGDLIPKVKHPTLKYRRRGKELDPVWPLGGDGWPFMTAARPFLTQDDRIYVPGYYYLGWPFYGHATHLAVVDLKNRKRVGSRKFISGNLIAPCERSIRAAPGVLKEYEALPHKDDRVKYNITVLKEISEDTVPENEHGPFLPFSRVTCRRFGDLFECRMDPKRLAMVFDRKKVEEALASRTDADGLFALAELRMADNRMGEAADLLTRCLNAVSSEDLDFRSLINQQMYRVRRQLARSALRSGAPKAELKHCIGMSQSVTKLSDELETMFALAEAYERNGDLPNAARQLQSVAGRYGQYEYPIPSLVLGEMSKLTETARTIIDHRKEFVKGSMHADLFATGLSLWRKGLPFFFSSLSPLEKDLTVRAGELAAANLARLQRSSDVFAKDIDKRARAVLMGASADEQTGRLWEFPATATATGVLADLLEKATREQAAEDISLERRAALRRRLWQLADAARICRIDLPPKYHAALLAPRDPPVLSPVTDGLEEREKDMVEARGTAWLLLDRNGHRKVVPARAFLAGRVKKKFDNKFLLYCIDTKSGNTVWKAEEKRGEHWFEEIRLKGKGDEPGFVQAFVCGKNVLVHGRYDVLAFGLEDGKLRWRYRVPFDFEIREAVLNGDLLVLSGQSETVVLYARTEDPRGEVVWQEKEEGDVYVAPYFHKDRLVSVRKLPFNVTVRYRATGKLIGRLEMPDLTMNTVHPLIEKGGPVAVAAAHHEKLLVVTDGWYYIAVDIERMKTVWKRLIDDNDITQEAPMRFALHGPYFCVVKKNYDLHAIYMLSSRTGELLWRTDPKDARSPQPLYSMRIRGDRLYGLRPHAGQGFYVVTLDCKTGKALYRQNEQAGYAGRPSVELRPQVFGSTLVAHVKDRQNFELKAFDGASGKLLHTLAVKGAGDFGEYGRVSATVQDGALIIIGKNALKIARK